MSIEHTCENCSAEYDTRHGTCPSCGAAPIPGWLIMGLNTLLVNFDEDSAAGRRFTRDERQYVTRVRRWLKQGVLYAPKEETDE